MIRRLTPAAAIAALVLVAAAPGWAAPVPVSGSGTVSVPAIEVPSSGMMSSEGNASRVEHIQTERALSGKPIGEVNAALFGPRLERTKAFYRVSQREAAIGGVPVIIYEPADGIAASMRGRVLLNVHGGGFAGCFVECGGLESIPVAALAHVRVISIDYLEGPGARFPQASEDVAKVYRKVLETTSASRVGIFGCSAGGILTAQSLAWFQRRGLPSPAAAGVFCAGGDDPRKAGDSRLIGNLLGDGELPAALASGPVLRGYMSTAAPTDPLAFPAIDAATLARFPPTLIVSGTRDFMLSGAVSLHAKLVGQKVDARLHVWEGGRHAFFYDVRVPEAREAHRVIADFFMQRLR